MLLMTIWHHFIWMNWFVQCCSMFRFYESFVQSNAMVGTECGPLIGSLKSSLKCFQFCNSSRRNQLTSSRYDDVHTWSLCIKISLKFIFMSSFSPCCLAINSIFFATRFEVDGSLPSRWIKIQGGSCEFFVYKLELFVGFPAPFQHYSRICQWCSLCRYSNAIEPELELICMNWYQPGVRHCEHQCHAGSLRRASRGQKAVCNPEVCFIKKIYKIFSLWKKLYGIIQKK